MKHQGKKRGSASGEQGQSTAELKREVGKNNKLEITEMKSGTETLRTQTVRRRKRDRRKKEAGREGAAGRTAESSLRSAGTGAVPVSHCP